MKAKYKILVLSDLKSATTNAIKCGISLAKMTDANLQLFYVRKATDIVEQESQLSAKRSINRSFIKANNDIQNVLNPFSKDYNIDIEYNHAFGNVKNEIKNHIQEQQPDAIVIGKRKSNSLNFIGDNITEFVIKNFDGEIIIASEENSLEPNKQLSLGILNGSDKPLKKELTNNLIEYTQKPIKLFKTTEQEDSNSNQSFSSKETVELVFDYGDNSMKSLSNYLSKSDVNLLCVHKMDTNKKDATLNIKSVLNNVNVSLLIS